MKTAQVRPKETMKGMAEMSDKYQEMDRQLYMEGRS